MTRRNPAGRATAVKGVPGALTISQARCWPATISRCVWVLCLCFMGLHLSNRQIARELDLSVPDVQTMTGQLRHGLVVKIPAVELQDEVEIDEIYVVAGHKGQPAGVPNRGGSDAAASGPTRRAAARWRRTSRPFS